MNNMNKLTIIAYSETLKDLDNHDDNIIAQKKPDICPMILLDTYTLKDTALRRKDLNTVTGYLKDKIDILPKILNNTNETHQTYIEALNQCKDRLYNVHDREKN